LKKLFFSDLKSFMGFLRVVWDPEFGGSRSGTGPKLLNFAGPGQVPGPEFSNLAGPGKVPGPELLYFSGPGSNFKSYFLTKHDFLTNLLIIYNNLCIFKAYEMHIMY